MKRLIAALMLAAMLAAGGCATAQRMPRDQGSGVANPDGAGKFELEKTPAGSTTGY